MNKNNLFAHMLIIIVSLTNSLFSTTYWNWQLIDTRDIHFPQQFMWGVTSLSYETEGYAKTSTWYTWEKHNRADGKPFANVPSGIASAHSQHFKEDVQLIKSMGLTTYCFSLDWSRIEPEEGYFDTKALQYYIDLCDELIAYDITPIVILKDYCDPLWFGYLGGFEDDKNINFFERYCLKMYETLGSKVSYWITLWSPESYAMLGYLTGMIPPGVQNTHRAVNVLKNELEAHVRVYKAIKSLPNSNKTKIGISKHIHLLEPWHVWDYASCYVANMLNNQSFYNFFTTGSFKVKIPLPGRAGAWVTHTNAYASKSLDFIGINYYSHGYIKNLFHHISNPSEIPTDVTGITVYPEGLHTAIKEVSDNIATKLNIPIIVTQNGIATTDESVRDLYLKRHMYALSKAITAGYNVIGYCYYSLLDGFSWGSFDKKFGLFSIDPISSERKQKYGSKYYSSVMKMKRNH